MKYNRSNKISYFILFIYLSFLAICRIQSTLFIFFFKPYIIFTIFCFSSYYLYNMIMKYTFRSEFVIQVKY